MELEIYIFLDLFYILQCAVIEKNKQTNKQKTASSSMFPK